MSTLLIKNISQLVTCDDSDRVLTQVDILCKDGFIEKLGPNLDATADRTIDGSHMLCYPGLVNTHHHLYQVFSRNLAKVQNMELFDWLKTLYEIWKNLDSDVIRLSSLTGMGELMKHGCTTCFDHHYVFPAHAGDLLGTQFAAADELGIRMYCSRGSMDLSVKDGGLPPDSVVQTVEEIMKDSARVIEQYHDPSYGAMHRVANTSICFKTTLPGATTTGWFGELFLSYGFLAYLAIIVALGTSYFLNHTRPGLHLRAVGESASTADAAGINVTKYKYLATCIGSMIAGLGGLYYVMDYANGVWSNNAFGDRGWLAIALVIFTIWRPNVSILASILFGGLYILNIYLPTPGGQMAIKELYKMLPYAITLVVLIVVSLRKKREDQPPASLGLSYFREER